MINFTNELILKTLNTFFLVGVLFIGYRLVCYIEKKITLLIEKYI
ncbi:hypothetical protein [Paraclostridium bifermentans]|nr:hypothetical protein [Paraclostridium bifermentans]